MLTIPTPPPTFYHCPGERHPISRVAHLARLSRHYAECRNCPHRAEHGLVSLSLVTTLGGSGESVEAGLIFTDEGVRGRYLNDLTRSRVQHWGHSLAAWLWSDATSPSGSLPVPPSVVVGFDERPSSPDLALGMVTGLRQAGCRVIDIGLTTPAVWQFAANLRQSDAAVLITGAGQDASWTGLEILGPGARPIAGMTLERQGEQTFHRPTEAAGVVQSYSPWDEYEIRLATEFHALRPLHVAASVLSPLVAGVLQRLFAPLPCRLSFSQFGRQAGSPLRWDVAVERLQDQFREKPADLGFVSGEDGRQLALLDETGDLIPDAVWQPWLLTALGAEHISASPTLADSDGQIEGGRVGWIDGHGRFWHGGETPACDALLTVAAVLRALSWSDAPISERVAHMAT